MLQRIADVPLETRRIIAKMYDMRHSNAEIATATGVARQVVWHIVLSALWGRHNAVRAKGERVFNTAVRAWNREDWVWFRANWPLEAFVDYTVEEKVSTRKAARATAAEAEKQLMANYVQAWLQDLGMATPEAFVRVHEVVRILTPTQLKILVLRLSGKSYNEIGQELGVTPGRVYTVYHYNVLTRLRRFLGMP